MDTRTPLLEIVATGAKSGIHIARGPIFEPIQNLILFTSCYVSVARLLEVLGYAQAEILYISALSRQFDIPLA